MNSILIIDDDRELCELLEQYLSAEDFCVARAYNGRDGLQAALSNEYDLVILDVMLPQLNGLEVLAQLRHKSNIPVIMLTARGEESDRVNGLELGADDYLPKPFSPRELVARIKAIIRRSANGDANRASVITVADISLDMSARTAWLNNEVVSLTEVELGLLEQLLQSAGLVVSRQELAQKVLGRKLSYDDRSLDVHMSNLRKKLGPINGDIDRIRTVRGVGYLYVKIA